MPLANIATPPAKETVTTWDFNHQQDHLEIVQAAAKIGITLPLYPIYPVMDHDQWTRLHQQFHTDMNKALGITNASDLQAPSRQAMDTNWFWRNYQEHKAARLKLGI